MKTVSKCTALIALLLITNICFANSILGSYTPTYQYFKLTYPSDVTKSTGFILYITSDNFLANMNRLGQMCSYVALSTTPTSSEGGTVTFQLAVGGTGTCTANLVLPLKLDEEGNIETNNTSYTLNVSGCNVSTLTATVTGNPDSSSGYKITIK